MSGFLFTKTKQMKRLTFMSLMLGLVLASCGNNEVKEEEKGESWETNKETFMNSCQKSALQSSKSAMGPEVLSMIDETKLEALIESQCACQFQEIKSKYKTPEEAFEKGVDKVIEGISGCEPSEEEINDLFK